jgi:SAM-dependent methyltransferase
VNDYDSVADLYDLYVQSDFDLAFFREEAQRTSGAVLELMAGTGRVTAAIADASRDLTCVDRSLGMLRVLRRKLGDSRHRLRVVCADVCALPLHGPYGLVIIPFHSFAELTRRDDQRQALAEIRRVLAREGRFICTLHNPAVRITSLDGASSLLGTYARADGPGELDFWVGGTWDDDTRVAESQQTYKLYGPDGSLESERTFSVRFMLLEHAAFEEMAREAGFAVQHCYGDYDRAPFKGEQSPYMIWVLGAA